MKKLTPLELKTLAPVGNPTAGFVYLYFKSDGKLYKKDSSGVETEIGAGGGGTMRVVHGAVASTARPSVPFVEWVGSVEPTNAIDGDTWYQT